jgi:hypothetical protein
MINITSIRMDCCTLYLMRRFNLCIQWNGDHGDHDNNNNNDDDDDDTSYCDKNDDGQDVDVT